MSGLGIGVLILLAAAAAVLFVPKNKDGKGFGITARIAFFSKGRESGFGSGEISTLYSLAKRTDMGHPGALFWSRVQLDSCIKSVVAGMRDRGEMNTEENQLFLQKLFALRKKLELENPQKKLGIKTTLEIEKFQSLEVVLNGAGVFISKLLENTGEHLRIERPVSTVLPVTFAWPGKKVIVYFTRKEDAHYCFDSAVIDEFISDEAGSTLTIMHNPVMERMQYRTSMRAKTNRAAFLYPASKAEDAAAPEVVTRVKCSLVDISDTGCAVLVGGTAPEGYKVIVQFVIDNTSVSMGGTVRTVKYNEENNTSVLHIRAEMIPQHIQNLIMCVVLGAIENDDALEEEAVPVLPDAEGEFEWDG